MNTKEFKSYKKELKHRTPYQKVSNALAASIHGIKAPMEMRKKLADIKEHKRGIANRMKNKHESAGYKVRHDYMGHDED